MKNKTQQLLTYIIQNHKNVPITSLMKLSYIVDLVSMKKRNNKISDFDYKRYKYGPFDDKIYRHLTVLRVKDFITEDVAYTWGEDDYIIYKVNNKKEFSFDKLNTEEKEIINEVIEAFKGYGAKSLTKFTYKTKPMKKLGAKVGNNKGLNQKLDLSLA